MNLIKSAVTAALVAGVSLVGAQNANAAFINGSISFSDGFDPGGIPAVPTSTIVSGLTSFNLNNVINVFDAGTGDFSGVTGATAFDVAPPPIPTTMYTTNNGFTFTVTSLVSSVTTAFNCNAIGLCRDGVELTLAGTVSGGGFQTTGWIGIWTANGACQGAPNGAVCTGAPTASWSSSVVATGQEVVPEPATMVLLGMGLLGAGIARRRRA